MAARSPPVSQSERAATTRRDRVAWNTVVDTARKAFPLEKGKPWAGEHPSMATADSPTPRFTVTDTAVDIDTLVVGFTEYGLAGLTAVDYLSDQLDMRQAGHLEATGPPHITPFEGGVPRHHTRLYVDEGRSLGVIVGE